MTALWPDAIAICLATFEPDMALFRAQVQSLRDQTDARWICLVSDDHSTPARFDEILAVLGDDRRFVVSRSERRLGFYRNFERALQMVPERVRLIALCDQDDRWHADKLAMLRAGLGPAQLAYSDLRLVTGDGRVLRDTLWAGRSNNYTNMASLLIANTITGAASLFRREVADAALPFPDTPGYQFHDHWIGLVALALGEIAYIDRPLYDYVQHSGAVFGDVTHGSGPRRPARDRPRLEGWRAAYFYGYLARDALARVLLVRTGSTISPAKRRGLEWFLASQRSALAFGWLVARPVRRLIGRNETLGSELELAQGIIWKWLTAIWQRAEGWDRLAKCPQGPPPLAAFDQKRLRRWRAEV
jgi:glycosyltransferase involved in cell wall biosynthesis